MVEELKLRAVGAAAFPCGSEEGFARVDTVDRAVETSRFKGDHLRNQGAELHDPD